MISVYHNKINNNVSSRDYDGMKRYIALIQWGRRDPVQFIEKIFNIKLMDYQKMLIAESWTKEYVVWCCSRNIGKSFLVGCFIQARSILFPKLQVKVISENWTTANDTFKKMEDIATNNIKTIVSNNTVFIDELLKTKSDSDGFTHDAKNGSHCTLLNGSTIQAVAGQSRSARGKRSNLNVYDEAGFISKDTFDVTEPFMAQDSGFKLGGSYDADVYPQDIPNLRLYIGSASDKSSYFYAKYKEGFKQMLIGNDKYYVADLSCEIPMHPTVDGNPTAPLLSQAEVDRKTRENAIAANREYRNIFDSFDSETAVVSRQDIFTNSEVFVPKMRIEAENRQYIIAYDPASRVDNAPVLIMEVFKHPELGLCGRCVHMENLVVTYGDGSKRPMRIDEQVARIRQLILYYNGFRVPDYEKVTLLLDAGVGGQASAIAQELCKDWKDDRGFTHHGVYDENHEFSTRWAEGYKDCVPGTLKLVEPRKFRNDLFAAAKVLVPQGIIKFPVNCPKYDILVLDDGTERKLSKSEMASLIEMDLMKEEVVAMTGVKSATTGIVSYQLPAEKRNVMHDDRAYVFVLCCWQLRQMRDEENFGDSLGIDYSTIFNGGSASQTRAVDAPWFTVNGTVQRKGRQNRSPFQGSSPFQR